jgi:hypothetical protein
MAMPKRRDTLKAAALLPILGQTAAAQQHDHQASAAPAASTKPAAPRFLTAAELSRLAIWCDLILPRTDTPGASDAGVPLRIDGLCFRNAASGKAWRETLAWLDAEGKGNELALLTRLNQEPAASVGARHFRLLKNTTIEQYYSTEAGLKTELGWNANTYLAEFKGCTHPEHQ